MAYNGLETVKPTKPIKRGDLHIFPKTTADQIITDETTDKRLTTDLAEKMPKSGGTFTGTAYARTDARTINYGSGELVNITIRDSSDAAVSTKFIVMRRK